MRMVVTYKVDDKPCEFEGILVKKDSAFLFLRGLSNQRIFSWIWSDVTGLFRVGKGNIRLPVVLE